MSILKLLMLLRIKLINVIFLILEKNNSYEIKLKRR